MTKPADSRIGDVPLKAEREGVATLPQKSGKEKFTDKLSQLKSLVSAERAAVTPVSVSVGAAKAASPFLKKKQKSTCMHLQDDRADTGDTHAALHVRVHRRSGGPTDVPAHALRRRNAGPQMCRHIIADVQAHL